MAITWKNCMENKKLTSEVKHKVFQTTSAMTLLYAAPCFGFFESDIIESVQRFYLKRSLKLPLTTPNYMLALETGLPDLSLTALKLHFDFIIKLLTNEKNKLSKRIALEVVQKRSYWFAEWRRKAQEVDMDLQLNIDNIDTWSEQLNYLLNKLHLRNLGNYSNKAKESQSRYCYPNLNLALGSNSYFRGDFSQEVISCIFKLRGELIYLNYFPHRQDLPRYCPFWEGNVIENILHFIGKCKKYLSIRISIFNKTELSDIEVYEYLNGADWMALFRYHRSAFSCRVSALSNNNEFQ